MELDDRIVPPLTGGRLMIVVVRAMVDVHQIRFVDYLCRPCAKLAIDETEVDGGSCPDEIVHPAVLKPPMTSLI